MILRRVISHVKEQAWTAIIIDLMIVIVGVFIGTQVSNWNESRHEAARAQGYLTRIHGNLDTDLQSITRRRVFWGQVVSYGHGAIRYAETGELVDGSAWKTVLAFYQSSQLWPWSTTDTTYQELRNAGELGLITDDRLRSELAKYYIEGTGGGATDFMLAIQPEYRKIVRGLTPSLASAQVWAKCHNAPNLSEQYLYDCQSPMSESQAQAVLDTYVADPHLVSELRFWITNLEVSMNLLDINKTAASALLKHLDAEPAQ